MLIRVTSAVVTPHWLRANYRDIYRATPVGRRAGANISLAGDRGDIPADAAARLITPISRRATLDGQRRPPLIYALQDNFENISILSR
jgi:hypothetical protein